MANQGQTHQTVASKQSRREAARIETQRRKARKRNMLMALGAAFIVVVVAFAVHASKPVTGNTSATGFDLPSLHGNKRVRLDDLHGKPTVVNMFASWCDQCDAELPEFHRVAKALNGKVNFVFVNSNETGNGRPMADRHHLQDFTVAKDINGTRGNGLYRSLGGASGMPLTAFYDANGNVVNVAPGALLGNNLDQAITQYFSITV